MGNDRQTGDGDTVGDTVSGNKNIWAPWRMEYINGLSCPEGECFLCSARDGQPSDNRRNLLLWRGESCMCILNRFPYTGGHVLVAPYEHAADLSELPAATLTELMEMARDIQQVIQRAINPQGFNIGINVGRCAGAGLPGHLHIHVVPRWDGDTNFMSTLGNVRAIPEFLSATYDKFHAATVESEFSKRYACGGE